MNNCHAPTVPPVIPCIPCHHLYPLSPPVSPVTTCIPCHHLYPLSPPVSPVTTCIPCHHLYPLSPPVSPVTTCIPCHHLYPVSPPVSPVTPCIPFHPLYPLSPPVSRMLTSISVLLCHLYKCTTTVVRSVVSFQYYSQSILSHGGSSGRTVALEMAGIQLSPPGPFNFKSPDEWPRWRRRYEQFQIASGLAAEPATKQVSTFLYCL